MNLPINVGKFCLMNKQGVETIAHYITKPPFVVDTPNLQYVLRFTQFDIPCWFQNITFIRELILL